MAKISAFPCIRPTPNRAAQVASVPYDVIDTAEARKFALGPPPNPHSFLHVVRSEIDLPEDADPYSDAVYERARQNLDAFIESGTLIQDATPKIYLYRLVMGDQSQIGVVCCCHIDDYINDVIRKHELTRKDKEDDRTRHVLTLNANAEPVFLTYRDRPEIDGQHGPIERETNKRPLYHFVAPDGVTHTVWEVADPSAYVQAFADVDVLYIADGHHRTASAARAGAERRAVNPNHAGSERYNWFLSVLFPASQLQILPYNRVVKDLAGKSPEALLNELASVGHIADCPGKQSPDEPGSVCFYMGGDIGWRRLAFDPDTIDYNDPIASLDVSLLQQRVLEPILGIGDVRSDKRIDFVGGIRGTMELEERVSSGRAAIAFSMYPTTIEQLMAISDAGRIMPPKSTWFEPKLRSGLFIHPLD